MITLTIFAASAHVLDRFFFECLSLDMSVCMVKKIAYSFKIYEYIREKHHYKEQDKQSCAIFVQITWLKFWPMNLSDTKICLETHLASKWPNMSKNIIFHKQIKMTWCYWKQDIFRGFVYFSFELNRYLEYEWLFN